MTSDSLSQAFRRILPVSSHSPYCRVVAHSSLRPSITAYEISTGKILNHKAVSKVGYFLPLAVSKDDRSDLTVPEVVFSISVSCLTRRYVSAGLSFASRFVLSSFTSHLLTVSFHLHSPRAPSGVTRKEMENVGKEMERIRLTSDFMTL